MNMKLKKLLNDIQKTEDKIAELQEHLKRQNTFCLLYTSPSPRDGLLSRMPSSA